MAPVASSSRRRRLAATGWVIEVAYLGGVAILATVATSDPNHPRRWALLAVLAVCLPALVALLPVLYVAVSTAFNVTHADNGGTRWPVTATYVVVLSVAAATNVILVLCVTRARQRRLGRRGHAWRL
jgi:hypothetical protein